MNFSQDKLALTLHSNSQSQLGNQSQAQNLPINRLGNGERSSFGSEMESMFGQMIDQIGQLGQYCKFSFKDTQASIAALESTNEALGVAVTELIQDKSQFENAIITQANLVNSTMQALKMTKDEVERISTLMTQFSQYCGEEIRSMEEWRLSAEPKILNTEENARKIRDYTEKLQADMSSWIPVMKRLSNYDMERQELLEELRKLKTEVIQIKKTQELFSDKDVELLKKQVKELLDAKSDLYAKQLVTTTAIQKLQAQERKGSKDFINSSKKLTSQEITLLKSLDATTTIHDKALEEINERIDRFEDHLFDPELLKTEYRKELADCSKRTDITLEALEVRLNRKSQETEKKIAEIKLQLNSYREPTSRVDSHKLSETGVTEKIEKLEKTLANYCNRVDDNEKNVQNVRSQLDEIKLKIEKKVTLKYDLPQFDTNELEKSVKRVIQETKNFQRMESLSDTVELNNLAIGRKMEEIKHKVDKIERNCVLNIQTQVDILRDRFYKLGDS